MLLLNYTVLAIEVYWPNSNNLAPELLLKLLVQHY